MSIEDTFFALKTKYILFVVHWLVVVFLSRKFLLSLLRKVVKS